MILSKSKQALREIAAKNDLSVSDLTGPSRKARIMSARIEAMHLMRTCGLSAQRIATALNRDYSTVRYHLSAQRNAQKRAYAMRRWWESRP